MRELKLLTEDGVYIPIFDTEGRDDVDDADCVHTPLLVPFAVTRRRVVGLWVRVGGYAPVDERLAARGGLAAAAGALAQIDAAQLFAHAPFVPSPAAPLRASVAARGAAALHGGELRMRTRGGRGGAFLLHLPSALVPLRSLRGGAAAAAAPAAFRVTFDVRLGGALAFCYGELPPPARSAPPALTPACASPSAPPIPTRASTRALSPRGGWRHRRRERR